jgi:hypothetical protein
MGVSVEWAVAHLVAENFEVKTKAELDAAEWTDSYGSEVTSPYAVFMDNGSGLMVIEGTHDELVDLFSKIKSALISKGIDEVAETYRRSVAERPGASSAEPDKHDWTPGRSR